MESGIRLSYRVYYLAFYHTAVWVVIVHFGLSSRTGKDPYARHRYYIFPTENVKQLRQPFYAHVCLICKVQDCHYHILYS